MMLDANQQTNLASGISDRVQSYCRPNTVCVMQLRCDITHVRQIASFGPVTRTLDLHSNARPGVVP